MAVDGHIDNRLVLCDFGPSHGRASVSQDGRRHLVWKLCGFDDDDDDDQIECGYTDPCEKIYTSKVVILTELGYVCVFQ